MRVIRERVPIMASVLGWNKVSRVKHSAVSRSDVLTAVTREYPEAAEIPHRSSVYGVYGFWLLVDAEQNAPLPRFVGAAWNAAEDHWDYVILPRITFEFGRPYSIVGNDNDTRIITGEKAAAIIRRDPPKLVLVPPPVAPVAPPAVLRRGRKPLAQSPPAVAFREKRLGWREQEKQQEAAELLLREQEEKELAARAERRRRMSVESYRGYRVDDLAAVLDRDTRMPHARADEYFAAILKFNGDGTRRVDLDDLDIGEFAPVTRLQFRSRRWRR